MKKSLNIKEIDTSVGKVTLIELSSKDTHVTLTSYGAGIYDFDFMGKSLVVRPRTLDDYLNADAYYGKTIGRTSGRLFPPSFSLDEKDIQIKASPNDQAHLHGGKEGFSHKNFQIKAFENTNDYISVTFNYISEDMEEGYPGRLDVDVTYILNNQGELILKHEAKTTKDTLCNLTNHIYFNFNENKENLNDMFLKVDANQYVLIDENYRPKGLKSLNHSSFDLRQSSDLVKSIKQLENEGFLGFDNAYLINQNSSEQINLFNQRLNIGLKVQTDYPSVVVYTHNYEDKTPLTACDTLGVHSSVTLECQYEPSGIYHSDLNDAILRSDETYEHYVKFSPYKK